MVNIHYLDKDQQFYRDLSSWLPDYCTLKSISLESISKLSLFKASSDIVIINPDYTGNSTDFLNPILHKLNTVPVIFISDSISLPFVVSMMKNGAYTFLHKRKDKSILIDCIKGILYSAPDFIDFPDLNQSSLKEIIGNSNPAKNLKYEILNYSGNNLSILLLGESGTGKELAAKALHYQNFSDNKPLITVNCGAIPETLIESELFGTKKGAFTDAGDTIGFFEKANGGTIFLDEISELSKSAQVKLLRVLEDGVFYKVGDSNALKSQFNLITATNKNLKIEVTEGRFREDLFYRITPLIIKIPPLRERKEDIYELSLFFLDQIKADKTISHNAILKLIKHSWPGNIRELKHTISRAAYLSKDSPVIDACHIHVY
jgi:DNA-binding NtrC family response regulator